MVHHMDILVDTVLIEEASRNNAQIHESQSLV